MTFYIHGAISVSANYETEGDGRFTISPFDKEGKKITIPNNEYYEFNDEDTACIVFVVGLLAYGGCGIHSIVITYSESA